MSQPDSRGSLVQIRENRQMHTTRAFVTARLARAGRATLRILARAYRSLTDVALRVLLTRIGWLALA
jgi:hypothetical protein